MKPPCLLLLIEVDMSKFSELENNTKKNLLLNIGVGLGFMSFLYQSCNQSFANIYPDVNAMIDSDFKINNDFVIFLSLFLVTRV